MTDERERFITESRKRLIERWGCTNDQADIATAMLKDAMAFADAHREAGGDKAKADEGCDAERTLLASEIWDILQKHSGGSQWDQSSAVAEFILIHRHKELGKRIKLTVEKQRAHGILRAIISADERGQGLPFKEAMDAARKELDGYVLTTPPPAQASEEER